MTDYKQSEVTGTTWTRAGRVMIDNPLGGTPSILFAEEEATNLGTRTITNLVGNICVQMDPANPKHLAAYNAINEIYIEERERRDALLLEADSPVS